jgi:SAM-dependent methyltransferase
MTDWVAKFDRFFYPDFSNNWDDSMFREVISDRLSPDSIVLDLGAGAGIVEQMNFKKHVNRVCGVDLDPRVVSNPFLHEGKVGSGEEIPYADNTFDVVFSDNVLEHLDDPKSVFVEITRVLKPGGVFFFKTPNRAHYMPLIARLTPHRFHSFINRLRGRAEVDTFPTRYRVNTRRHVRKYVQAAGMILEDLRLIEGRPEYMRIAAPLYLLGILYEKIVNSTELLSGFRILLIGSLAKPR